MAAQCVQKDTVTLVLDCGAGINADNDAALGGAARIDCEGTVVPVLDRGGDIHVLNDYAPRWVAEYGRNVMVALWGLVACVVQNSCT
jgi:hypothetical protein